MVPSVKGRNIQQRTANKKGFYFPIRGDQAKICFWFCNRNQTGCYSPRPHATQFPISRHCIHTALLWIPKIPPITQCFTPSLTEAATHHAFCASFVHRHTIKNHLAEGDRWRRIHHFRSYAYLSSAQQMSSCIISFGCASSWDSLPPGGKKISLKLLKNIVGHSCCEENTDKRHQTAANYTTANV